MGTRFVTYGRVAAGRLGPLIRGPCRAGTDVFTLYAGKILGAVVGRARFEIRTGALLIVPPRAFMRLLRASSSTRVCIIVFSRRLVRDSKTNGIVVSGFRVVNGRCVFPLSGASFRLCTRFVACLSRLCREARDPSDLISLRALLACLLRNVSRLYPRHPEVGRAPNDERFGRCHVFVQLMRASCIQRRRISCCTLGVGVEPTTLYHLIGGRSKRATVRVVGGAVVVSTGTRLYATGAPVGSVTIDLNFGGTTFFGGFFGHRAKVPPRGFHASSGRWGPLGARGTSVLP